MTKRILITVCFSLLTFGFAQVFAANNNNNSARQMPAAKSQIQWYTDYSKAVQVAKKENKPLLLFFTGSDWCGWCKKMDQEIFSSPEFAKVVGNDFIFVEVDFPMNTQLPSAEAQQNATLKQKYGVTGYPTVIVLSPSENFIAETGYRPGGGQAYAEYLRQLIH